MLQRLRSIVASVVMDAREESRGVDCQSPENAEDVWVEKGGIGEGGFGVVKLFVNKVGLVVFS